ncbi:MAG: DMT family transporter [Caulobacteraceae bacterium]|nr:DMT family transporter [Caulobacteraceae bacterium]
MQNKRLAFIALLLAGVFWGAGFPLGKVALREIDAAHMILLRLAFAGLAALPFALRRPQARALFRAPVVLISGALYGVAFLVQFEGLARIDVSLAALLVGAMPALIAIAARIMGEPVSRLSWIGVIAASAGAALGVALSLTALLLFLAWIIISRRAPKPPTNMAMPAATVIVAAAAILPVSFVLHGAPPLHLSAGAWAAIAAQGVFCTFLATAGWQFAAPRVGNATAGVFVNIEPLIGAVLGVSLFGDRLTLPLVLGGLLIITGSVVVVLGEKGTLAPDLTEPPATPA